MRFKNLTIILTLTCLSVIAFAGLAFLPITNGICASWTDNSFGSIGRKSLSDNYSMDATFRGWSLSASVIAGANAASASASPSITGLGDFTESYAWIGHANTYAKVDACTVFRLKFWSDRYHDKIDLEEAQDSATGELRARVDIAKQAWASAEVKVKSDPSTRFNLNAPEHLFGEIGAEIDFSGNIYIQISNVIATYDVNTALNNQSNSQESSVSGSSRAHKKARIDTFWFGTQSINGGEQASDESDRENYDPATVKYVPPPLDYAFIQGSLGWIAISY